MLQFFNRMEIMKFFTGNDLLYKKNTSQYFLYKESWTPLFFKINIWSFSLSHYSYFELLIPSLGFIRKEDEVFMRSDITWLLLHEKHLLSPYFSFSSPSLINIGSPCRSERITLPEWCTFWALYKTAKG